MASQKQIEILRKHGFDPKLIAQMDYATISEEIGKILASNPFPAKTQGGVTTSPQKQVEHIEFQAAKDYKPKQSYHLTPEQVRFNAMEIALRIEPNLNLENLKKVAEDIESWMLR